MLIDREVNRFIAVAENNGIRFHIQMPDGTIYGAPLQPVASSRKRGQSVYPFKTFTQIFDAQLASMRPGEVRVVTSELVTDPERLRKGLTSAASTRWGPGNYTSAITGGVVEFLRLA